MPHRKLVRHFEERGDLHEITFSCYQRRPLLRDDWRREQLSIALDRAMKRHGWRLAAFVFMPEHVHLITYPVADASRVDQLLFAVKRPYSFRVKQRLVAEKSPLLDELTIRRRPGDVGFRFWQEGPGYDRNLRTEPVLLAVIDYLHLNPVRRGLVRRAIGYRWSSARWYASEGQEVDPAHPRLVSVPADWFDGGSDAENR